MRSMQCWMESSRSEIGKKLHDARSGVDGCVLFCNFSWNKLKNSSYDPFGGTHTLMFFFEMLCLRVVQTKIKSGSIPPEVSLAPSLNNLASHASRRVTTRIQSTKLHDYTLVLVSRSTQLCTIWPRSPGCVLRRDIYNTPQNNPSPGTPT